MTMVIHCLPSPTCWRGAWTARAGVTSEGVVGSDRLIGGMRSSLCSASAVSSSPVNSSCVAGLVISGFPANDKPADRTSSSSSSESSNSSMMLVENVLRGLPMERTEGVGVPWDKAIPELPSAKCDWNTRGRSIFNRKRVRHRLLTCCKIVCTR